MVANINFPLSLLPLLLVMTTVILLPVAVPSCHAFSILQNFHQHSLQRRKQQSSFFATDVDVDEAYQPYTGEQPVEALSEIFQAQVMPNGIDEELLWVPQTDCVSFRPLCLCVSSGYYVNLLRVRGAGLLSRHRHPGPVHGRF